MRRSQFFIYLILAFGIASEETPFSGKRIRIIQSYYRRGATSAWRVKVNADAKSEAEAKVLKEKEYEIEFDFFVIAAKGEVPVLTEYTIKRYRKAGRVQKRIIGRKFRIYWDEAGPRRIITPTSSEVKDLLHPIMWHQYPPSPGPMTYVPTEIIHKLFYLDRPIPSVAFRPNIALWEEYDPLFGTFVVGQYGGSLDARTTIAAEGDCIFFNTRLPWQQNEKSANDKDGPMSLTIRYRDKLCANGPSYSLVEKHLQLDGVTRRKGDLGSLHWFVFRVDKKD